MDSRIVMQDSGGQDRALFVTFEGGEGSGKTTQIEHAAALLRRLGRSVVVTREPGGSPGADAVRRIVLSGQAKALGPQVEAILFAAARADHLALVIRPALAAGHDVLCDRFHDSTRVYQGTGGGVDAGFLQLLEEATIETTYPDLTIILDVSARIGLQRAAARRGADPADRFEVEGAELHEQRRQAFLRIAQAEPARCEVVDASRDVDTVSRHIEHILTARLAQAGPFDEAGDERAAP